MTAKNVKLNAGLAIVDIQSITGGTTLVQKPNDVESSVIQCATVATEFDGALGRGAEMLCNGFVH